MSVAGGQVYSTGSPSAIKKWSASELITPISPTTFPFLAPTPFTLGDGYFSSGGLSDDDDAKTGEIITVKVTLIDPGDEYDIDGLQTNPLLDDYRVSRADCLERLQLEGLDVIKSGCFHCPYAGSNFYRSLRENHPDLFEKAILLEANAERRTLERTGRKLRSGLVWGKKLRLLDDYHVDDATCDSGAGCFI